MNLSLHGIDLHYELRGRGAPLLLVHGFTGCGGDFVHLFDLDELGRRNRLIIPDLRSHGRSTGRAEAFTFRQCGRDLAALLDALGAKRCKAVGISGGGNALLHLATAQPERVEAMVLAGSPSHFPPQARAIFAEITEDQLRAGATSVDRLAELTRIARGFAESEGDMAFLPALLSTIRARTLVVDGDRDPLYPVEIFVEMYRAIPNAQLWIIPGEGHAPVFGDARGEFVRRALAFLG